MIAPSFLIGLGSTGVQVLSRVRQLMGAGSVPESVRLLAFDLQRPRLNTTGRLGSSPYFLISLPPVNDPSLSPRRAARQTLLKDLRRGSTESQVLRGLALNLEALRAQPTHSEPADVFLITSSFGSAGSGFLIDIAYLCRHLAQNRLPVRLHAVVVAPEAYQHGQTITKGHYLQNFTLLKELEFLQGTRSWATPYPLYGGKSLGGIPGQMTAPPFDSVQVVDGNHLNTGPEAGIVAAVAEGLLCQIDGQARQALDEIRLAHPCQGRNCFSSFGVFSFYHPSRLLRARTTQRLITAAMEMCFPIEKNELTGRPEKIAERTPLRQDDPYGNLTFWLSLAPLSGVLEDILQESSLPPQARHPDRLHFLDGMVRRARADWEMLLNEAGQPPDGQSVTEKIIDLAQLPQEHVRILLNGIIQRILQADDRLGPLSVYLGKLETALNHYLEDLDQVEEIWKGLGEHSESEAVRKAFQEAQRDVEEKRSSNWSKLFSQGIESAGQHLEKITQSRSAMLQREAAVQAIRKSARVMRWLTTQLLAVFNYYADAAVISGSSIYNAAMDEGMLVDREVRFEHGVRAQQVIIDQGYEARQMRALYDDFTDRFFKAVQKFLEDLPANADWENATAPFQYPLDLGPQGTGQIDLLDTTAPAEERAHLLWVGLSRWFEEAMLHGQPETSILNFLSYHEQRGERLAVTMSERSLLLAKLLSEPPTQEAILFTPEPDTFGTTAHTQAFVSELQHHFTSIYLAESRDTDRMVLLRWGPSLSIDNFFTYHQSAPKKIDPSELRDYVLW